MKKKEIEGQWVSHSYLCSSYNNFFLFKQDLKIKQSGGQSRFSAENVCLSKRCTHSSQKEVCAVAQFERFHMINNTHKDMCILNSAVSAK